MIKAVSGAPLQLDASANFMFNDKFLLGAAYRWDSAISGLVGFQVSDNIFIGAAYDYQTSSLNYSNGSYELIFRFDVLSKQAKAISPRFFLNSNPMKQFKINTYIILVGALMMISSQSIAQKSQMNLVNKEFDKYAATVAREVLLKLTDEGFESDEVFNL